MALRNYLRFAAVLFHLLPVLLAGFRYHASNKQEASTLMKNPCPLCRSSDVIPPADEESDAGNDEDETGETDEMDDEIAEASSNVSLPADEESDAGNDEDETGETDELDEPEEPDEVEDTDEAETEATDEDEEGTEDSEELDEVEDTDVVNTEVTDENDEGTEESEIAGEYDGESEVSSDEHSDGEVEDDTAETENVEPEVAEKPEEVGTTPAPHYEVKETQTTTESPSTTEKLEVTAQPPAHDVEEPQAATTSPSMTDELEVTAQPATHDVEELQTTTTSPSTTEELAVTAKPSTTLARASVAEEVTTPLPSVGVEQQASNCAHVDLKQLRSMRRSEIWQIEECVENEWKKLKEHAKSLKIRYSKEKKRLRQDWREVKEQFSQRRKASRQSKADIAKMEHDAKGLKYEILKLKKTVSPHHYHGRQLKEVKGFQSKLDFDKIREMKKSAVWEIEEEKERDLKELEAKIKARKATYYSDRKSRHQEWKDVQGKLNGKKKAIHEDKEQLAKTSALVKAKEREIKKIKHIAYHTHR